MRRAQGEDHVAAPAELPNGANVLETCLLRTLSRRCTAPGRRPDGVPADPQGRPNRRRHLTRVEQPNLHGGSLADTATLGP